MDEAKARVEICRVGKSLFDRGYVHSTAGNISVRLADGFLITPTDACLGFLEPEKLAKLDTEGQQLSGDKASKTILLHRRIYEATEQTGRRARSVIHTHSSHLLACSLMTGDRAVGSLANELDLLPPITPYFVMKVGHVPHIGYRRPGDPEVADAVSKVILRHASAGHAIRAVMLARLGPSVWHESPLQAMATLEELEETAKLFLLTQGACKSLSDQQIEELRQIFGASW